VIVKSARVVVAVVAWLAVLATPPVATALPAQPPPPPAPETVAPLAPAAWAPGLPPPPPVPTATWLVADLDTGNVLGAQGEHIPLPPASTIKMLTALALLPTLDKAATYTATYDDAVMEGSKVGLFEGGVYTVDQLFLGLFLQSGNDTAHALGQLGGGQDATVQKMNAIAAQLGAKNTHAVNTSGLDAPGQVSSAHDLAVIARAGLQREDFARYAMTQRTMFPGKNGATYEIANNNRLLYRYPGAIGVKTGFTTQAGRTYVGAAQRDGRRLVATFMNTKQSSWDIATALLDWGFAASGLVTTPLGNLSPPATTTAAPPPSPSAVATTPPTSSETPDPRISPVPMTEPEPAAAATHRSASAWVWVGVPMAVVTLVAWLAGMSARIRRRSSDS
jgi:serine-type D-Ala-D-Ala carboxypeptidase (penicillin-binding protein 5/6)